MRVKKLRKLNKQITAGVLSVMLSVQLLSGITTIAAAEADSSAETFNKEGVWLTEIYQNDVDRSQTKNTREQNGYDSIHLYNTSDDLMEFVEITSTYDAAVNFNDLYEIYYGDTKLSVPDVTIEKGQSVVLWNYRSDLSVTIPTEEEFREDMRIPDDAVVLKVTSGQGWAGSSTFSIKRKPDGKIVSTFTATDKVHTQDGFSVELKVPNLGSEMEVCRALNMPSAGVIYSGQLNGLVKTQVPNQQYANGVYITEIRGNDVDRSSVYGTTSEVMECLEIVNTTDKDVDLNNDCLLEYFVKEGTRKVLPLYHYSETAVNHEGSSESCIVPAGGTAVIWCFRKDVTVTDTVSLPTEAEFRYAYGISDDIPVYIFTNQNGINNSNRGFELYELQDDGTKEQVCYYVYQGTADMKDEKSAELTVNPEGPAMLLSSPNTASSLGAVKASQYTYVQDDGSYMELRLNDEVPESIMQGDEIRVKFYFNTTGNLPRKNITTYYRFDGTGKWYSHIELSRRVPNLYEAMISADELFSHEYVEFYVCASNTYHNTLTEIYRVDINKINDFQGIRTNISEGEEVRGTVSVTANDGGDNSNTEIYVDGTAYNTVAMFEDGAYFTYSASDRDNYFETAITTTENEVISYIGKWQDANMDGRAIRIDNSYFTYNQENNSYDITLRIWSGTYSATDYDYLMPDANRDDFKVSELAMKLINGNVYYPTAIGPDNAETSARTNLSTAYDAVHTIGDSAGMCPYIDISFSVPVSEVEAVGAEVDTTVLSEGEHTLKVTNGASTEEVTFVVDNTAPVIDAGVEDGGQLTGKITLDPQVSETNTLQELVVTLDGEQIATPYEVTAYDLGEGEHTLAVSAMDTAGNVASETVHFTIADVSISLEDAGADDVTESSAELYLNLKSNADAQATFYKAEKISAANIAVDTDIDGILPYIQYTIHVGDMENDHVIIANWDGTASNNDDTHATTMFVLNTVTGKWDKIATADAEGSMADVSFPAENYVSDGKVTVLVQCTADSALPDLDTATDGVENSNANWDGNSVPEDYDFCIAWETDTQYYTEQWQHHFLNMNQWIVDNADDLKIKYVIHTGDIVDDYDMIYQWENADEAMGIFDEAGLPYGVLGGNHDVAAGLADYENYYTYFGEDRFESQPTYGGSYKNNSGHYDLISEDGQDMVIIYMSWNIYQEEIDWMNEILQKYSDRKAIICFHSYTNVTFKSDTFLDYFGELIQKEVVAKNPNVFAVLNGHYHGSSYETVMFDDDGDGVKERTVYQICTDYQSGFEGGSEYVKFLYFDLDNNKIYMNSYSPYLNDYNFYDTDLVNINVDGAGATGVDKMVLDVDFNTEKQTLSENQFSVYVDSGEELGTAEVDKDTGKATLKLSSLETDTEYSWYAVVTNENTGYLKTGVYNFTTGRISGSDGDGTGTESTPAPDMEGEKPANVTNPETGDPLSISLLAMVGTSAMTVWGLPLKKKKRGMK